MGRTKTLQSHLENVLQPFSCRLGRICNLLFLNMGKVAIFILPLLALGICDSQYPTVISRGVFLQPLEGYILYSSEEFIYNTIIDIPDPPNFMDRCMYNVSENACQTSEPIRKTLLDILEMTKLMNKALTQNGLSFQKRPNISVDRDMVYSNEPQKRTIESPPPELIQAVGTDWYDSIVSIMENRKLLEQLPSRSARSAPVLAMIPSIGRIAKPLLMAGGPYVIKELFGNFKRLFVGAYGLEKILLQARSALPDERKLFATLNKFISDFEAKSKILYSDVLSQNRKLHSKMNDVVDQIHLHRLDITEMQDNLIFVIQLLEDFGTLFFTNMIYFNHYNALSTCRSGKIPLQILPPLLLQQRLVEIENNLPADLVLSIPSQNFHDYYALDNIAQCAFDDYGGVIRIKIPLKERSVSYKLFEVKSINYKFGDNLCRLPTFESYAVKTGDDVYIVSDLDEEDCKLPDSYLCKVPLSTGNGHDAMCINSILQGNTVDDIRQLCPMTCSVYKEPQVTQMNENTFIITNAEAGDAYITKASGESLKIDEYLEYGAWQIILACGDTLFFRGKNVGRYMVRFCDPSAVTKIEILLPIHMTTLNNLVAFSDDTSQTKLKSGVEIFNPHFIESYEEEDDWYTMDLPLVTTIVDVIQSLIIFYLMIRIHIIYGVALPAHEVEAATEHYCKLPSEIHIYFVAVIFLLLAMIIPKVLGYCWGKLRKLFWTTVQLESQRV